MKGYRSSLEDGFLGLILTEYLLLQIGQDNKDPWSRKNNPHLQIYLDQGDAQLYRCLLLSMQTFPGSTSRRTLIDLLSGK